MFIQRGRIVGLLGLVYKNLANSIIRASNDPKIKTIIDAYKNFMLQKEILLT